MVNTLGDSPEGELALPMPIEVVDVIKAIVTPAGIPLLSSDDAIRRFREATDEEAVPENQNADDGEPQMVISLDRDRTTITKQGEITWFEREYPARSDLPALAGLVATCLEDDEVAGQHPRAIGYQLHFLCDQKSGLPAANYLAQRVINPSISQKDWEFLDWTCTFSYHDPHGAWRFNIEPRFLSETTMRIFIRADHYILQVDESPSRQEMETRLELAWGQTLALLRRIEEGDV